MLKFNVINVEQTIDTKLSLYLQYNEDTEKALNNGIANLMNFNSKSGTSFDTLTYLAVNYFYDNVYVFYKKDEDDNLKKHKFRRGKTTTIAEVKALFDACNHTAYTPIHTLDTADYVDLFFSTYYTECYLIIQAAYFFGSIRFGQHPYIKVVEYYKKTGIVLENNLNKERLESAFAKIDNYKDWQKNPSKFKKKPLQFNKDTYLNNWYYGVLDILANTFGTCINYKYEFPLKNGEISEYRYYNKLIQTPQILRKVQPFEMIEFDIKSGHLSYIDLHVGSNVSKTAYEKYGLEQNVSRDVAKRKFQSILNLREFRNTWIKKQEYIKILCGFGWTIEQANKIVLEVTDALDYLFGHWASKFEMHFVNVFAETNDLKGWTRGHDALYCIKRRDVNYTDFCTSFENGIIQFELEKTEIHDDNLKILQNKYKPKKNIYFSGLRIENITVKKILDITPPIVMKFNDCVLVIWKKDDSEKRQEFIVPVNLNYHQKKFDFFSPKIDCKKNIHNEVINAYNTFLVLNNYTVSSEVIYKFCQHVRKHLLFDVVAYSRLLINEDGNDFVPKLRSTRISLNYDNNKVAEYTDDYEDDYDDGGNVDYEDFNNMVAMNTVIGICSRENEIIRLKILLLEWIYGKATIDTKPKKHTESKDLLTKMYEIDCIGKRANVEENAIFLNKSSCIISASIIRGDLFKTMVFCPKIDRKRTKIRQQAQLKKQEQDWHKADEKRTNQMLLAKEIASQIDDWLNYEPKYNIEYVTKNNYR